MYKASIRALMRYSVNKLNNGDYSLMLKMASPDFELAFPGQNSWATMFRPQQCGRKSLTPPIGVSSRPSPSPTGSSTRASGSRSRTSSSTGRRGTHG